jgi:hypothetical protein
MWQGHRSLQVVGPLNIDKFNIALTLLRISLLSQKLATSKSLKKENKGHTTHNILSAT